MSKIAREVAEQEIEGWLTKKKVFASQKEANKDSIEILVEAISEGVLVLNPETNEFIHKLLFPIENEIITAELKYKPRLNDNMLKPHLNGLKPTDGDGRMWAHIAALTGVSKNILTALDSIDKKIAMAIVVFFV